MRIDPEKVESVVSQKRVKQHIFEPSNREIWTVVGKGKEYWLDPESDYCSCEAYYFGKIDGHEGCYHLQAVKQAKNEDKVEIAKFSDDEFEDFLSGLIDELNH